MRKLIAAFALLMGSMAMAAPASANDHQPAENKDVTFCHATAVAGKYQKLTTSLNVFLTAGHVDHVQGGQSDIYPAITYTTKGGDVVTIPAQGDQSLLAFDDCAKPAEDKKIAKPDVTYVDKCDTKDDVFSVAPGEGYTVGAITVDGLTQTIIVTTNEGYAFTDGSKSVTFTRPVFTDVDCDLPETGVGATYNTLGGLGALAGLALGGYMLVTGGRRKARA